LRGKLMMNKARPDGLLEVSGIVDWPASERDGYNGGIGDPMQRQQVGPRVNTVVNAYYYDALQCMARLARALNKDDEAQDFETRAAKVADAFNATFFDAAHGNYRDGEGSNHTSLHANMFPMAFGLVPPEHAASVADFVQGRGMACSVFGAQFLLEALYGAGRSDAALALLTSYGETSWAHMMDLGSTMTLEAWDPSIKPNLTWNHAWGAAPANIIARYLLGVRPLTPGYKSILIAPQPGSLKWMRGKVPIPHGAVTVVWQNTPASLQITVPLETTARVELPREGGWQKTVSVNGQPIVPKLQNGTQILEPFPPGSYLIL
jgi:alpha-L-rhamnosidase